jgi:predicted transcriptional regulator of viral defense system
MEMAFIDFVNGLCRQGKCAFTITEAIEKTGKSRKAILSSIAHLVARNELATPAKGFYVIVPPEYQILGCIPGEHFLPYLMDYWGCDYYVGLLSAAAFHGASHQAVQRLQVMINKIKLPISCGKVNIEFITNRHLNETPTQIISTPKSMIKASTPEGTAKDLLEYPHRAGGLNSIYTVIDEMLFRIEPARLSLLAKNNPHIEWKQRLGYILTQLSANKLIDVLKIDLAKKKAINYIWLIPGINNEINRDKTWKIKINTILESDL